MEDDPKPYPRVPHLPPGVGASRDDKVLSPQQAEPFFRELVVVEEKLDGASVALWLDSTRVVRAGTRGGSAAVDRAGQLGPLRAWAAERADQLATLLDGGTVLYGEWLWLAHGVRYQRLPDWLIGLDLWRPGSGFLPIEERDGLLAVAGVTRPPQMSREILGSELRIRELLASSAFGEAPAEGLIVRRLEQASPDLRLAKVLSPAFTRRSDAAWRTPSRNALTA